MPKETIKKLYDRYEMDFLMFGYIIEPFYSVGYNVKWHKLPTSLSDSLFDQNPNK